MGAGTILFNVAVTSNTRLNNLFTFGSGPSAVKQAQLQQALPQTQKAVQQLLLLCGMQCAAALTYLHISSHHAKQAIFSHEHLLPGRAVPGSTALYSPLLVGEAYVDRHQRPAGVQTHRQTLNTAQGSATE